MTFKNLICWLISGGVFFQSGYNIPERVQKMVHKEVIKVFEAPDHTLEPIIIPPNILSELPANLSSEHFFAIKNQGAIVGYCFIDKAPSKTAEFDYLVVFNNNLEIIHSKVLIYREEYGGEIGSRRWLKQFLGLSGNDNASLDNNIDGIAGATISVRSMTHAIDNLLSSVGELQKKNFFK